MKIVKPFCFFKSSIIGYILIIAEDNVVLMEILDKRCKYNIKFKMDK